MPTILSLADLDNHGGNWLGQNVEPMIGTDFSEFLAGDATPVHDSSEAIGYELGGNSALFKGDYKIVINSTGQNETEWHLFNIRTDPGEARDLARQQPDLLEEMVTDYERYVQSNNVLPMPERYNRTGRILGDALRQLNNQ